MKIFRFLRIAIAGILCVAVVLSCSEEKSPTDIATHPQGWNDVNSEVFHGEKVAANHGIDNCMTCHGETLDEGGESGVACTDCHNSGQVEQKATHNVRVQQLGWEIETCTYCHGSDYTGNEITEDCTTCHTREAGPEACNTCHGDFDAEGELTKQDIAPPPALRGETGPVYAGVGLHQFHLDKGLTCIGCHADDVDHFDEDTHIDGDGVAEINSTFMNSWDREEGTCTAVCHMVNGEFEEMQWTY
ncbi:MAG: hypothetical protein K9N46_14675 [Candidatus Marinimicrobia bacterium]|nr:hypothetical protein [Candidatus Neomarinimicrobiota bacterium]MCF7828484.1 hypothetical protein [Candidatus Neomarinimicrobiota bacterium]MCF7881974.1 hypothetical protein [Candidatus Neomarinimicrobiota bacterium]